VAGHSISLDRAARWPD